MRRHMAVLTLVACVLAGCASAADLRKDGGDDSTADRTGARASREADRPGQHGPNSKERHRRSNDNRADNRGANQKKANKKANKKKAKKRRAKKRKRSDEVRLRNIVGGIDHFTSPSGNIGCLITRKSVRCDIAEYQYDPPKKPQNCKAAYGTAFSVGTRAPELRCVSDSVLGASTSLPYGSASSVGNFGCQSRRNGMHCYNLTTGRGFMVAQAGFRFY